MPKHLPALVFWRRVIGGYTQGAFVEHTLADEIGQGALQVFDNSQPFGTAPPWERVRLRQTGGMHPKSSPRPRLPCAIALACTCSLAAQAQPTAAPGFNTASQVYRCASGLRLPVVYLNILGGDSFAALYVNGTLALLRSGPTGSGANYLPTDDKAAYRWHVKGDLGSLWFRAAFPGAAETMVLQGCKAQTPP